MRYIVSIIISILVGVLIGYNFKPNKQTTILQPVQVVTPDKTIDPENSDLTGLAWEDRVLKVIFSKRTDFYEDILTQFQSDEHWFEKCKAIVMKTGTMGQYSGMVIKRIITGDYDSELKAEMLQTVAPNSKESLIAQQIMAEDLVSNYKVCTLWWKCLNAIKTNPTSAEVDSLLGYWKRLEPFARGGYNTLQIERNKLLPKAMQVTIGNETWECSLGDVELEKLLPKADTKSNSEIIKGDSVKELRLAWDRSIRYYKTQAKTKSIPVPLITMNPVQLGEIKAKL